MPTPLDAYIAARQTEAELVSEDRLADLAPIAGYITANRPARLTFVCTHNSRRSHLAMIWSIAAARRFGLSHVETFSGGTEATAFNPRAVAALQRAGMAIEPSGPDDNPRYRVDVGMGEPLECFSKVYSQAPNPPLGFAAVMTCDEADAACPSVAGADARFSLTYVDPKAADGQLDEAAVYDERCAQIAREMLLLAAMAVGR